MADSSAEVVNACLNLMRRLSPKDIKDNLSGLISLAPAYMDDLLQRVDQPLEEDKDPTNGRNFLLCEYNRDEESYRSPWSNQYFPPLEDAYLPGSDLRKLEVDANELLDAYRDMYYEGGVSSVYLWDTEEGNGGFAGAFLISKKVGNDCGWQSIHVVEVSIEPGGKRAAYKLNTTVMLSVRPAEHSLLR
jgi:capping protein beta